MAVFYLRAAPAVMTSELMRDFHIGAAQLGNLSAFYFYFYVAMQIPVGVLTDSMGPRKLLVWGSITAAAGTFLFGSTDHFALACAGRAIVGGATAVGWLVLLRLTTHWFPSRSFGAISGLGLFFGNIGALFAQVPLRIAIEHFSWRWVETASALLILAMGLMALLIVRNDPSERGYASHAPADLRGGASGPGEILAGFRHVIRYKNPWLILVAQGGMVGPIMTFTGLWGPPFLEERYGLDARTAAMICSIMIVCWAMGCPIAGHLSDRTGSRKSIYLSGSIIIAAGWIALIYVPMGIAAWTVVSAVMSFVTGVVIIGFAYARESAPLAYMGAITAMINIGNMLGPSLLQPGIGWLLDLKWAGTMAVGAKVYGVSAFHFGFAPIVAWALVSAVIIAFTKETFCRQTS
jgi:sugar phosphate permease